MLVPRSSRVHHFAINLCAQHGETNREDKDQSEIGHHERGQISDAVHDHLDEESVLLEHPDEKEQFQESQEQEKHFELWNGGCLLLIILSIIPLERLDASKYDELSNVDEGPSLKIGEALIPKLYAFDSEKNHGRDDSDAQHDIVQLFITTKEERDTDWHAVEPHVHPENRPEHLLSSPPLVVDELLDRLLEEECLVVFTALKHPSCVI